MLAVLLLLDAGFVLLESSTSRATGSAQQPAQIAQVQIVLAASATPEPTLAATQTPTRAIATITITPTTAPEAKPTSTATPALLATAVISLTPVATLTNSALSAISADPCSNPEGQLLTDTIASKVLGLSLPVNVYLPPCYDGSRYTYPALYLIQGSAYNLGEWVIDGVPQVAGRQMSQGVLPPFIIVMPGSDLNASNGGKYLYSTGGKGSWDDFMVNELAPMIQTKYGAWTTREGRAIGGISRGGYWSLEIGFAHLDFYSAIGGHSPSITPDQLIGVPANFSMLSFVKSMDALKTARIFLDAGATDWAQAGVNRLSGDLDARGITYTVSSGDGGHADAYWSSRIPDYLAFYSANWPKEPTARNGSTSMADDTQGVQP
ncbi:MAG TPA: alpha/beta hydrolase-fold protein [Anaerolineae bacterium]